MNSVEQDVMDLYVKYVEEKYGSEIQASVSCDFSGLSRKITVLLGLRGLLIIGQSDSYLIMTPTSVTPFFNLRSLFI